MFPTKNMMDYTSETIRLFRKTTENEIQTPQTTYNTNYMTQSPFFVTMANQSSSSADSTSPESFPEMPGIQFQSRYTPVPDTLSNTPFPIRRQRPIIGRKIIDTKQGLFEMRPTFEPQQISGISPIKVVPNDAEMRSFWHEDIPLAQTPPKPQRMENQNVYELFPSENRGFEFRTPGKNISSLQTHGFNSANISPSSTTSMSPVSPLSQRFKTPPPPFRRNYLHPAPMRINDEAGRLCSFCRKNGETPLVYMTHTLKERVGNRNIVTCPILRSHVCSTCHATGDDAHTMTYCPVLRSNNNGLPLQSTTITLKNTRVKSNGRKRY